MVGATGSSSEPPRAPNLCPSHPSAGAQAPRSPHAERARAAAARSGGPRCHPQDRGPEPAERRFLRIYIGSGLPRRRSEELSGKLIVEKLKTGCSEESEL